ncbi:MAG: hypothetical protein M0P31_15550 [Solirubrobacteraceae bacterium]|nr:hypothetical protein [Solirubrobacteraceae bacterium]
MSVRPPSRTHRAPDLDVARLVASISTRPVPSSLLVRLLLDRAPVDADPSHGPPGRARESALRAQPPSRSAAVAPVA